MKQTDMALLEDVSRLRLVIERQSRNSRRLLTELEHDALWSGRPHSFAATESGLSIEEAERLVRSFSEALGQVEVISKTLEQGMSSLSSIVDAGMDIPAELRKQTEDLLRSGQNQIDLFLQANEALTSLVNTFKRAQGLPLLSELPPSLS